MNWQLLFTLIGCYTALFFLLGLLTQPGSRYLRDRFQGEFGLPMNDQNIAALPPEQLARWDSIRYGEFRRTPFRWLEICCAAFHYPSIFVLGFLLRRNEL